VNDEVERMKYLIVGVSSYNKYIRSTLGLEINDLKTIYSKFIADGTVDKNHAIKELCGALGSVNLTTIPSQESDKPTPVHSCTQV
jgi:hypothetical protein